MNYEKVSFSINALFRIYISRIILELTSFKSIIGFKNLIK